MLSEDVQVRPGIQVLPKRMTIATNLPSTVKIFLASDLFSCISIKVTCDLNDHRRQQHLQGRNEAFEFPEEKNCDARDQKQQDFWYMFNPEL